MTAQLTGSTKAEKLREKNMSTDARKAFWKVALGDNSKLATLAKKAIAEAEKEALAPVPAVPEKVLKSLQEIVLSLLNWENSEDLEWIQRIWPELRDQLKILNATLASQLASAPEVVNRQPQPALGENK